MINSVNFNHLPIQDLVASGLIIFIMSTIIANIYDPLLGITYAFGNILTPVSYTHLTLPTSVPV